ncbi:expressed unknown protein [Seminavis robusta]|uniref:Uncharacterized protein n=1 Tax=Seminavis robusta TaxID=568900 RepID=A0A9N8EFL7_9STRA|nr:expressed unknown protein [Seminavis robusta]|eukprot:Sro1022_g232420.1 n/a (241) ;mRNA; r:26715-27437
MNNNNENEFGAAERFVAPALAAGGLPEAYVQVVMAVPMINERALWESIFQFVGTIDQGASSNRFYGGREHDRSMYMSLTVQHNRPFFRPHEIQVNVSSRDQGWTSEEVGLRSHCSAVDLVLGHHERDYPENVEWENARGRTKVVRNIAAGNAWEETERTFDEHSHIVGAMRQHLQSNPQETVGIYTIAHYPGWMCKVRNGALVVKWAPIVEEIWNEVQSRHEQASRRPPTEHPRKRSRVA